MNFREKKKRKNDNFQKVIMGFKGFISNFKYTIYNICKLHSNKINSTWLIHLASGCKTNI